LTGEVTIYRIICGLDYAIREFVYMPWYLVGAIFYGVGEAGSPTQPLSDSPYQSGSTGVMEMPAKKFKPEEVIGKPYQRGMLPYGGAVTRGKISSAIDEAEYRETMKRLKAITP
jgi:hypothetical protein